MGLIKAIVLNVGQRDVYSGNISDERIFYFHDWVAGFHYSWHLASRARDAAE